MQCPECKHEVEDGKAFCYSCGARLIHSSADIIPPPPGTPLSSTPPPPREDTIPTHKSTGKVIAIIMGALIILLLGLTTVWAVRGELPFIGKFPLAKQLDSLLEKLSITKQKTASAFAPADTFMYIEATIDPDDNQFVLAKQLWGLFPGTSDIEDELRSSIENDSTCPIVWDNNIKPWLGETLSLFYETPESADVETPNFAIAMDVKDEEALDSFLSFMISDCDTHATTTTYKGVTVTIYEDNTTPEVLLDDNSLPDLSLGTDERTTGSVHAIKLGGYLFLAYSKPYAERIIDVYKGDASLSEQARFKDAFQGAAQGKLLGVYLDPTPILELAWEESGNNPNLFSGGDVGQMQQAYEEILKATLPLAAYAQAQDNGILATLEYALDPSLLQENLKKTITQPTWDPSFKPTLPSDIPDSTALYLGTADIKGLLEQSITELDTLINGLREQYILLKASLQKTPINIDLDEDVLSWLNGETALVVLPGQTTPTLNIVIKLDDPDLVDARLQALIRVANTYAQQSLPTTDDQLPETQSETSSSLPQLIVEDKLEGVTMYMVTIEDTTEAFQPVFAIIGNNLVISTTQEGLLMFIEVNQGKRVSLVGDATYQSLLRQFPDQAPGFFYLNTKQALETFAYFDQTVSVPLATSEEEVATENQASSSSDDAITQAMEQIEPFKGIMGDFQQQEASYTIRAFFLIE
jgi:hypothetical protein